MSETEHPAQPPGKGDDGDPAAADGVTPLIAELRLLVQEAGTLARTEFAFQASRAKLIGTGVRGMALAALFAIVFVIFALGGLTVGLLLALTPLVSAWGATAIVVGLLLLGAALCALGGLASWRRMKRILFGERQP